MNIFQPQTEKQMHPLLKMDDSLLLLSSSLAKRTIDSRGGRGAVVSQTKPFWALSHFWIFSQSFHHARALCLLLHCRQPFMNTVDIAKTFEPSNCLPLGLVNALAL